VVKDHRTSIPFGIFCERPLGHCSLWHRLWKTFGPVFPLANLIEDLWANLPFGIAVEDLWASDPFGIVVEDLWEVFLWAVCYKGPQGLCFLWHCTALLWIGLVIEHA